MKHKELLLAISDMMDQKLDTLNVRMDTMENRLSARIDDVENRLSSRIDALDAKIDAVENKLSADINAVDKRLSADIRNINITLENIIIPRISHIEQCYLSTSERYINETGRINGLVADMQVIKSIVQDHSVLIQKIS